MNRTNAIKVTMRADRPTMSQTIKRRGASATTS
jgi:hypothetical protein